MEDIDVTKHKLIGELKFFRRKSDHYLFFKSSFTEDVFKCMSASQLGSVSIGEVYALRGPGEGVLYQYYKVRTLPGAPYLLTATWDILNCMGWLRAVGASEGIEIPLPTPITQSMSAEMLRRADAVLNYLWSTSGYADELRDVVMDHVLFEGRSHV